MKMKKPPTYFKTLCDVLKVLIRFFYGDKVQLSFFNNDNNNNIKYNYYYVNDNDYNNKDNRNNNNIDNYNNDFNSNRNNNNINSTNNNNNEISKIPRDETLNKMRNLLQLYASDTPDLIARYYKNRIQQQR